MPEGAPHPDADAVVQFAEALGIVLDPWQEYVLRNSLRRRAGLWAAMAVAVCAPRQNGKNGILEVRELAGPLLLGEKLLVHTAHRADTSQEAFMRIDQLIDANEWLSKDVVHIRRQNGHEGIKFRGGNRIRFRTRTKGGGGRGFAGQCVIFDEAMYLPESSMGAIFPVVSAQPDPQVWYTGSAVDQYVHEDGVVFSAIRSDALSGRDPRLAYFEWSHDADHPDQVTAEEASDPEVWAASNPALGIRVDATTIAVEHRRLAARTFAVERLGVGDWPPVDGQAGTVLDLDQWDTLRDLQSRRAGDIVVAFDVTPDRSTAAVAVAGYRLDGRMHVEYTKHEIGTGWVVPYLTDLVERQAPAQVVCDASGPAGSLVDELEQEGVRVHRVSAPEHAQACGQFYDRVGQATVSHIGQPDLLSAVKGATSRTLGDAWAWSRKNSAVDISPLVAVTLASWGAARWTTLSDEVSVW